MFVALYHTCNPRAVCKIISIQSPSLLPTLISTYKKVMRQPSRTYEISFSSVHLASSCGSFLRLVFDDCTCQSVGTWDNRVKCLRSICIQIYVILSFCDSLASCSNFKNHLLLDCWMIWKILKNLEKAIYNREHSAHLKLFLQVTLSHYNTYHWSAVKYFFISIWSFTTCFCQQDVT